MSGIVLFLLKQYWEFRGKAWGILFSMAITVTFTTVLSLCSKYIVDRIIADQNEALLITLFLLLLGGLILYFISEVFKEYELSRIGIIAQNRLRLVMFEHLQKLPVSYFNQSGTGSLLSRFTSDLTAMQAAFQSLAYALHAFLAVSIYLGVNASFHWSLALVSIACVALAMIFPHFINKRALRDNDMLKTKQTAILDFIQEHIAVQKTVRAFNLREWELGRLRETTESVFLLAYKTAFALKMVPVSVTAVLLFSQVVAVSAGAYLAIKGIISVGTLVAFQAMFLGISQQVRELIKHIPVLTSATASYKRIEMLLQESPEEGLITDSEALALGSVHKEISLNNVSFSYESDNHIFEGLDLSIPAGRYAAIIGMNGSGKSTLVNLIMRFYEPTEGSVQFDGTDTRAIPADSLREIIGYIPQNTELLNATILDNIRLGKSDAPDPVVRSAAHTAGIDNWIGNLPEGYRTPCGPNGYSLSGGQRQSIAIARALVRDPSILLLDEATSALDPDSELFIHHMLRSLPGGKTIINVTHRLSAVQDADMIYLMDKGKLVQSGSHRELLKNCELYRMLWNKQSGFAVSGDGRNARIDSKRLKQIQLFSGLDDAFLEYLAGHLETEYVQAGETVVERGGEGDKFYMIVRGRIEVLKQNAEQNEFRVAVLEDGDHFGEIALMLPLPRTATIRTLTPCTFLTIDRSMFQHILDKASPDFRWRLEQSCRERLTY